MSFVVYNIENILLKKILSLNTYFERSKDILQLHAWQFAFVIILMSHSFSKSLDTTLAYMICIFKQFVVVLNRGILIHNIFRFTTILTDYVFNVTFLQIESIYHRYIIHILSMIHLQAKTCKLYTSCNQFIYQNYNLTFQD